jgi:predicted permease
MRARENREAGMSEEEARWAARRQFGSSAATAEASREAWLWPWLHGAAKDFQFGARMLRRNPGFIAVAVLTLALGLGANMAIFTVLYNVVLRPLPYRAPDRLMSVYLLVDDARHGTIPMSWSYPKFEEVRRDTRAFESLAAYATRELNVFGTGEAGRTWTEFVSGTYFEMLGAEVARGRVLTPEDDIEGKQPVVVISDGFWRRAFGGDERVLGRSFRLNDAPVTIVGVLRPGFKGESGRAEVWTALETTPVVIGGTLTARAAHWLHAIGRLKPGATVEQARQEVRAAVAESERRHNSSGKVHSNWRGAVEPLADAKTDPAVSKSLAVLLGATLLVLLIACLNLSNLMLGRAVTRGREAAIRLAIGAGRGALLRQHACENLLLAICGCGAGLLLAWLGLSQLEQIRPQGGPGGWQAYLRVIDTDALSLNGAVLVFGVLLSLATALLFGLVPAWRASRADVNSLLKTGAQGAAHSRLRASLAVAQIAFSVVLLAGAGLMLRSLAAMLATSFGAETEHIVTLRVSIPRTRDSRAFFRELRERAEALPGVEAAAVSDTIPVAGHSSITILNLQGRQGLFNAGVHDVTPEFFRVFRVPLRKGRLFEQRDGPVVVINEALARRYYRNEDPIGRRMDCPNDRRQSCEIVGIVGDVRYGGPEEPVIPEVYSWMLQGGRGNIVSLRTAGDPVRLVAALRGQIRSMERESPIYDVRTMEDIVSIATSRGRFSAVLLSVFAAVALALAGIGVYGVFSYAVAARGRELAIRVAIGAQRREVQGMVLRDAALLVIAGLAVGLPAAFGVSRVLRSLLFQVQPEDPLAYAGAAVVLAATALGAAYLPARRAGKADPLAALRVE